MKNTTTDVRPTSRITVLFVEIIENVFFSIFVWYYRRVDNFIAKHKYDWHNNVAS
jgi:hypothetical protein